MKSLLSILIAICFSVSALAIGQINIAYSPYTISQPGSYIVVKDLTTAINLNCITITTSNVTLDLNGHTLYGYGTTQFTSGTYGTGIMGTTSSYVAATAVLRVHNITVKNGTITNFRNYGVIFNGYNITLSDLKVISNSSAGIIMLTVASCHCVC